MKAHAARTAVEKREADSIHEIAAAHGCSLHEFRKLVRIGYLSPSIVAAIVEGRQPSDLTRNKLARLTELPLDWDAQATKLGFSAAP